MSETKEGAALPPPSHVHTINDRSHRDVIADRTGELLSNAAQFTEQYQKPAVMLMEEPGTLLQAPALIGKEGIYPVPKTIFDPYRAAPERRSGAAVMTRIESFIDHVNRFKDEDSAIFACDDRTAPKLTAVLDYHEAVNVGPDGGFSMIEPAPSPRFGCHRTAYAFPLSDEWKAWTAANKMQMTMAEFAEFLEDRIVDVDTVNVSELSEGIQSFIGTTGNNRIAGPTTLMNVASNLRIYESSTVASAVNLSSGEGEIVFQSEHQDETGGKLLVPNLFIIAIPVFAHGGLYRVAARLRYRKGSGIKFWFDLWRTDRVFDDAFSRACEAVKDQTGLPLFIGAPE